MAEITYASIEPLLAEAEEGERAIRCSFRCPVTQAVTEALGPLESGVELADVSPGEGGLLNSLHNALGGLFSSVLGAAPSTLEVTRAADAAGEAFTDSERKAGIVLAFRTVASQFLWDPQAERWISLDGAGELLTDFDRQVRLAPIQAEVDRRVAARMLVEVARADDHVTSTEWDFLGTFIPGDLSSVQTYMEAPALTPEEFAETSGGAARETMLMLAWALAHVDDHLDDDEAARLMGFGAQLKIPEDRARELQGYAQRYLLETAFQLAYPKGQRKSGKHKEALALGEQLGMSEEAVAAFEERFKKRWGIE